MSALTILHNPRCSKSREALRLLRERGIEPQVVEYLKTPPSARELRDIVAKLGIRPEALVRKGEAAYAEKHAGRTRTDDEWIAAMVADPILIERPILVAGDKAVVGRPPERVLTILEA